MKVAIIGAGRQGARIAKAASRLGAEIAVVVDTNPAAAAALAGTYGCATSADWKAAVDAKGVDVVAICTPNDLHSVIATTALRAGKNVFCEKPMGRNPEEVGEVLEASRKSAALLKCGFNLRNHPAIAKAKRHVEGGGVGKLLFMRCIYGIAGRPNYQDDWRMDVSTAGGGELMDQGHHPVSALLETIDIEFDGALDARDKYRAQLRTDTSESLNADSLERLLDSLFPAKNKEGTENYSVMLKELSDFKIHTTDEDKDTWHRQRCRHRPDNSSVISFDQFCLSQVKQDNRFLPAANCQRFVILI